MADANDVDSVQAHGSFRLERELRRLEEELRLRAYSPKTVKAYLACFKEYFVKVGSMEVEAMKRFVTREGCIESVREEPISALQGRYPKLTPIVREPDREL